MISPTKSDSKKKRVPLSGQKSNKSDQIEQIK